MSSPQKIAGGDGTTLKSRKEGSVTL